MKGVLIVGAGLAGARCAETLRTLGYAGRVVLAGEEPLPPYQRPALSKELAMRELRPRGYWEDNGIELQLGRRVATIERAAWDAVVLATGVRARPLPGALTLRTHADAERLTRELRPGRRLAVVGAGFLGAEHASTAHDRGVHVTQFEAASAPQARILGQEVGLLLAERYRAAGVDLRLAVGVARVRPGAVDLADGTTIAADVVVAAIGAAAEPIDTDDCGRTVVAGVYACGDVASWYRPSYGQRLRVEHWTSASGQAASVATAILGDPQRYDEPPYFWSDQFGLRIQHVGHAETWASVELEGTGDGWIARYLDREGRLLAALAVNRQRALPALRRELAA
jgi:NADPH-dependent 2,4-dienoyl-CoA reductase/sulfur reductase-like enzyme